MKLIAKFLAATALLAGLNNAFAADGRKEATIDLGKGAFKLTVSVPAGAAGPYDFSKNPGPRVNINNKDGKGYAYGEIMYNAEVESVGTVSFKANAKTVFSGKPAYKGVLADSLAKSAIKDVGFEGRATPIDCPPAPIENASVVCYKMSGNPLFEGKYESDKNARVLVAVSFSNDTMGYLFMGSVIENDAVKFSGNESKAENTAKSLAIDLYRNMRIKLN